MTRSILIDASQTDETRVAVLENGLLEEYDVENQSKPSLKGNIYVAKVMRIEPSLQAAFVDFGSNKHGFLPLSEIHPDYFQIPEEDQAELIKLQEEDRIEAEKREQEQDEKDAQNELEDPNEDEAVADAPIEDSEDEIEQEEVEEHKEEVTDPEVIALANSEDTVISEEVPSEDLEETSEPSDSEEGEETDEGKHYKKKPSGRNQYNKVSKLTLFLRQYRIQEVLRKNQIILVQVVKEERGNKGAALTTFISLPGRYCVLMPNTLKSGGVSRRISSKEDRDRLRDLIKGLNLPRTMAMIVRTAGGNRPDNEILKDCEYLLSLWNSVREKALEAVPPSLVHEESSLLKRAVRDLVTPNTEQIIIESSTQDRKDLKTYIDQLMEAPAFEIKPWRNHGKSLFAHYGIEEHLENIVSPVAQLPSGGYLVINQTEALVAVDVNSGKSTNQRDVEATAYRTNLEAAVEVARQLRLRDLAGLIVIDFIDMSKARHNHQVERALREALRSDRARIQTGHISNFGLLEMSRQRLRPSLSEAVCTPCVHCAGTGITRSTDNMSVSVLRKIESTASANRGKHLKIALPSEMSFTLLNHKRTAIDLLQKRTGCQIEFALLPAHEHFSTTDLYVEINGEKQNEHSEQDGHSHKHNDKQGRKKHNDRNERHKDKKRHPNKSHHENEEQEQEQQVVTEEPSLAPGKKRTRLNRKKPSEETIDNNHSEETVAEPVVPVDDKPKRRTRRKPSRRDDKHESSELKTDVVETHTTEEQQDPSPKSDESEEKPKKKRAPAKRKTAKSTEEKAEKTTEKKTKKETGPKPINIDEVAPSEEKKGWWDR